MQPVPAISCATPVPLAVDLDGTLIRTDMMWESLAGLLRHEPLALLAVPVWWLRGRAHLKRELAARVCIDAATLPYNLPFLDWLKEQRRAGRKIVLATASDRAMAAPIAQHLGIFDEVLSSDGQTNLRDTAKLKLLTEKFGARGFDYAGNSAPDLDVWAGSREAIVVNAGRGLAQRAAERTKLGPAFLAGKSRFGVLIRGLRPHQWIKNLIVFVPVLTAHHLAERSSLSAAARAFAAFCLCASAAYLMNDLLDLEADRHHAAKRSRPFASGELPLSVGFLATPVLLLLGLGLTLSLPASLTMLIGGYFIATLCYSWRIKQIPLLDVFFLAGLYTVRLAAGHLATGIAWSAWLLIFSMFIFLSLALVKRFQELRAVRQQEGAAVKGRGYMAEDLELVTTLGIASGLMAVLVLALYVNSEQVLKLYAHPTLLLFACPLLLYWISRIWFLAHRGQLHEDPTEFAVKDWVSYLIGATTLLVMWLATGR
jgi:4-hydroxybenzoate polyprenyltransferase